MSARALRPWWTPAVPAATPTAAFPRHIIPNNATEIIPFLHICRTGLATTPDIFSPASIDLDRTIQVVEQNRDTIFGIKARMVSPALEIMGMEMPRMAKRAAVEAGVKLMVHIGDTEKAVRREGHPPVAAHPGGGRHRNAPVHRQPRRGHRFRGQAGARGQRGPGTGRVAGHGPRPHELQLRRGTAGAGPGPSAPLHQHRPDPARAPVDRPQHDRDDDPLPGHGVHPGPGG